MTFNGHFLFLKAAINLILFIKGFTIRTLFISRRTHQHGWHGWCFRTTFCVTETPKNRPLLWVGILHSYTTLCFRHFSGSVVNPNSQPEKTASSWINTWFCWIYDSQSKIQLHPHVWNWKWRTARNELSWKPLLPAHSTSEVATSWMPLHILRRGT